MFKRYNDPAKMLKSMSWHRIPEFVEALIHELHEEGIERVWYAKDIDKGLEEYRKESWKRVKRGGSKTNKVSSKKKEQVKAMEKKIRFKAVSIEDLEL